MDLPPSGAARRTLFGHRLLMKVPRRAGVSQLRIKPGVDGTFAVWTQYACLKTFDTFAEAADYLKFACCFAVKHEQLRLPGF